MANPRSRESQIEFLDGGIFDVLIVGAGVAEAAIFASLAARGITVAFVSQSDFGAHPNQDAPTLINDGLDSTGRSSSRDVHLNNKAITKLLSSGTIDVTTAPFVSLINQNDKDGIARSSRRIVSKTFVGRTERPKLIRREKLKQTEPQLRSSNLSGAIEYKTAYCPEGTGRASINLINHALSHPSRNAVAANYLKVINASKPAGKAWEVELKDALTGDCISLLAKTVVYSQSAEAANVPELSIYDGPVETIRNVSLSIPKLMDHERFLRVVNTKQRRLIVSPAQNSSVITSTTFHEGAKTQYQEADPKEVRSILGYINTSFKLDQDLALEDIVSSWTTYSLRRPRNKKPKSLNDLPLFGPSEQIQIDAEQNLINLVGARFASSHYLCRQVEKMIERMGISYTKKFDSWQTESKSGEFEYLVKLAKDLNLNLDAESMCSSLWRRHNRSAFKIVDTIDKNRALVAPIVEGFDYIWAEVAAIRSTEMVTCTSDFLLRRTNLQRLAGDKVFESVSKADLDKALKVASHRVDS